MVVCVGVVAVVVVIMTVVVMVVVVGRIDKDPSSPTVVGIMGTQIRFPQ